MNDLIERLEKLTGPDGETDAMIWIVTDRRAAQICFSNAAPGLPTPIPDVLPLGLGRNAVIANAPRYTASIDAALTLVPPPRIASDGGRKVDIHWDEKRSSGHATVNWDDYAKGATPAIALCIAALKAREQR